MSNYDELLEEARAKADAYRSTAKEYIPKMYEALCTENPNISPEDARDRIEKDCARIWAKRTILDALPDETKNPEKQKAGRLRQKEHNSAAFSAAPLQQEEQKIIVDTYGKPIEESSIVNDSLAEEDRISPSSISTNIPNDKKEEAYAKIIDFEFALIYGDIRRYMAPLYKEIGDAREIWFTGKLDIKTGKVIDAHIGRKRITSLNDEGIEHE